MSVEFKNNKAFCSFDCPICSKEDSFKINFCLGTLPKEYDRPFLTEATFRMLCPCNLEDNLHPIYLALNEYKDFVEFCIVNRN